MLVNGIACKYPKIVGANDFAFSGLHKAGNTSNPIGSAVTRVTVFQLQGLNTHGISLVRIDYARVELTLPTLTIEPPKT